MVALPTATAVTRPFLSTLATLGSDEVQVTDCAASLGSTVAVSCSCEPASRVASGLFKTIDVASLNTVTAQVALRSVPSVVLAVMVALPTATAVTRPLLSTLATLGSDEVQVTDCAASRGSTVAVSCSCKPASRVASGLFKTIEVASLITVSSKLTSVIACSASSVANMENFLMLPIKVPLTLLLASIFRRSSSPPSGVMACRLAFETTKR